MKIAMLGSRGIPANYSGVETCVENLATRLVERGHAVTVYCRPHMVRWEQPAYKGVRLVKLPTIRTKFLDTFAHTALCTLHMIAHRPDVALYFIAGNSPFVLLARLAGVPTVFNVDGLDSQRAKWGGRARLYLRFAEWLSARAATRTVTDSRAVQRLYERRFGRPTTFIAYGAELPAPTGAEYLERFNLDPRGYILFVGRLVPENGIHVLIAAHAALSAAPPLVVVGDAPYADDYVTSLRAHEGPRVIFTGYLFGEGYRQLLHNAYMFVLPDEVGGTHPALIEAMAAGNCIVVNDHEPNVEAIGDAGLSYDGRLGAPDLARVMGQALADPAMTTALGERAKSRASALYSWRSVTDAYERLCDEVTARPAEPSVKPIKRKSSKTP